MTTTLDSTCYLIAPKVVALLHTARSDEGARPRACLSIVSTADYSALATIDLIGDVEAVRALLAALEDARSLAHHVVTPAPDAGTLGAERDLAMQHYARSLLGLRL